MPQPYKGLRVKITTRLPVSLATDAQRAADQAGLTMTDWIAHLIAREVRHTGADHAA